MRGSLSLYVTSITSTARERRNPRPRGRDSFIRPTTSPRQSTRVRRTALPVVSCSRVRWSPSSTPAARMGRDLGLCLAAPIDRNLLTAVRRGLLDAIDVSRPQSWTPSCGKNWADDHRMSRRPVCFQAHPEGRSAAMIRAVPSGYAHVLPETLEYLGLNVEYGGRRGVRTPDRWCVKPELYH